MVESENFGGYNTALQKNARTSGYSELEKNYIAASLKTFETFASKQHDYGASNIGVGGLRGVAIRIGDKTSRLHNLLLTSEQQVSDETIYDTLEDLANYALIGCLLLAGKWPRSTPEDAWWSLGRTE